MLISPKKYSKKFSYLSGRGRTVISGADIEYIPDFLDIKFANRSLEELVAKVKWSQPKLQIFGRTVPSPRLSAWYGDKDSVYRYSGLINKPLPWLPNLLFLKNLIEELLRCPFNSVLLNLYRSGSDSMGWHRDNEPELGQNPVIASVSLGGIRRFLLRSREKSHRRTIECQPQNGSLLIMRGDTQRLWRHCVPKTRELVQPRLNLTFRQILLDENYVR